MHTVIIMAMSCLTAVFAKSDCHYVALAWGAMNGPLNYRPSANNGACCGQSGIVCTWIFDRIAITEITWRGLSGILSHHLFNLGDLIYL